MIRRAVWSSNDHATQATLRLETRGPDGLQVIAGASDDWWVRQLIRSGCAASLRQAYAPLLAALRFDISMLAMAGSIPNRPSTAGSHESDGLRSPGTQRLLPSVAPG